MVIFVHIKHRNNMLIITCWKEFSISLFLCTLLSHSFATTFTITNNCPYTIWPATLSGSASAKLSTTGFPLNAGQSVSVLSVPGWSGRIWARTGCSFDVSGVGSCQTGDCGGRLECDGVGATPPASLFELHRVYKEDVMLLGCPKELQVVNGNEGEGNVIACRSACEAFGLDQYCCAGVFANPTTCRPSFYSSIFKRACPRAYSYAYDDGTSTFTCKAYDYAIIFCPMNGPKRSNNGETTQPIEGNKMENIPGMVSSSNILLPFPLLALLIFSLH